MIVETVADSRRNTRMFNSIIKKMNGIKHSQDFEKLKPLTVLNNITILKNSYGEGVVWKAFENKIDPDKIKFLNSFLKYKTYRTIGVKFSKELFNYIVFTKGTNQ